MTMETTVVRNVLEQTLGLTHVTVHRPTALPAQTRTACLPATTPITRPDWLGPRNPGHNVQTARAKRAEPPKPRRIRVRHAGALQRRRTLTRNRKHTRIEIFAGTRDEAKTHTQGVDGDGAQRTEPSPSLSRMTQLLSPSAPSFLLVLQLCSAVPSDTHTPALNTHTHTHEPFSDTISGKCPEIWVQTRA